jgi:rare lipoprotein A
MRRPYRAFKSGIQIAAFIGENDRRSRRSQPQAVLRIMENPGGSKEQHRGFHLMAPAHTIVALLGLVGVAACTSSSKECAAADTVQQYAQSLPVTTKAKDVRPDLSGCKQTGIASFYADMFTGRKMADGTRMDPSSDNAASRTLPLGMTAKVTNLETGRGAKVTIQDRGPYVKGRIIDLSPATARQIGLDREEGIATVLVAPIEVPLPGGGVKRGEAGAGDRRGDT